MFDVFNSEYERVLTTRRDITYEGAFQEASRSFSERHGFIAYTSHDSFRKVRSYKRKR